MLANNYNKVSSYQSKIFLLIFVTFADFAISRKTQLFIRFTINSTLFRTIIFFTEFYSRKTLYHVNYISNHSNNNMSIFNKHIFLYIFSLIWCKYCSSILIILINFMLQKLFPTFVISKISMSVVIWFMKQISSI
jgi:hypothetical protein